MQKGLTRHKVEISKEEAVINLLKKGIWLYFLLIIFEGALRKWVLPGLQAPLLIVRDPLAIWLIYKSWKHNLFPVSAYVIVVVLITSFCICAALVFGHGNLFVAIYGARIFLLHFSLMFLIGAILNRKDVINIGKVLLYISIPMIVLIALQFYSPQSAWVNRGIGGDMEGSGFFGANGYFRPSGTFSFTTGNVMFFSFVASFVFYFWATNVKINKLILIAATLALLGAIPISISRTLMFSVGLSLIFTIIGVARKPEYFSRLLIAIVFLFVLLIILNQIPIIQTALEAFIVRFEAASIAEGGVSESFIYRVFGGMIETISNSGDLPFFGYGIGMGTNVGSQLLTGGFSFLISEDEWLRLVGELGFFLGFILILVRVILCFDIFINSFNKLKSSDLLPWILLSFGLIQILKGQWATPNVLGFSTLIGGLILASLKKDKLTNVNGI